MGLVRAMIRVLAKNHYFYLKYKTHFQRSCCAAKVQYLLIIIHLQNSKFTVWDEKSHYFCYKLSFAVHCCLQFLLE